jgi:hypothetical protein
MFSLADVAHLHLLRAHQALEDYIGTVDAMKHMLDRVNAVASELDEIQKHREKVPLPPSHTHTHIHTHTHTHQLTPTSSTHTVHTLAHNCI